MMVGSAKLSCLTCLKDALGIDCFFIYWNFYETNKLKNFNILRNVYLLFFKRYKNV